MISRSPRRTVTGSGSSAWPRRSSGCAPAGRPCGREVVPPSLGCGRATTVARSGIAAKDTSPWSETWRAAPISPAPVRPVRALAQSQRRLTSRRSIWAASGPEGRAAAEPPRAVSAERPAAIRILDLETAPLHGHSFNGRATGAPRLGPMPGDSTGSSRPASGESMSGRRMSRLRRDAGAAAAGYRPHRSSFLSSTGRRRWRSAAALCTIGVVGRGGGAGSAWCVVRGRG